MMNLGSPGRLWAIRPAPLLDRGQTSVQGQLARDLDVIAGERRVADLRPPPVDRVPEVGVAHAGGADVLDQPVDVGGVLRAVLQALHRSAVVPLHWIPELVHLVGVDAGAGALEPVELVDPAHLVRSRSLGGRAARAAQLDVGVALFLAGRGPPEDAEEGRLDEVVPVSAHPSTIPHRTERPAPVSAVLPQRTKCIRR